VASDKGFFRASAKLLRRTVCQFGCCTRHDQAAHQREQQREDD
jgi:hypothetical protein